LKILHCCLAAFYIDDAGYQENILPRIHQGQGHEVEIVASTETYIDNKALGYIAPGSYNNSDGILVTRLPYISWLPHVVAKKVRSYRGLTEVLSRFKPDILFLHNCQFWDVGSIIAYKRKNPEVKIFVDGHSDFINSATTWISKHLLHGVLYRYCTKRIEPHVEKFFGVLPARVDFFTQMYGVSPDKTALLVLGADDTIINWDQADQIRRRLRAEWGVQEDDFVLIAGGRIDRRKQFIDLLKAVKNIDRSNVKLILFGTPVPDVEAEITPLLDQPAVTHLGWVKSEAVYDFFLAADLGVFPGTHSVIWEQAIGTGLPALFRRWPGMDHVDVGGNCKFFESGTEQEVIDQVRQIVDSQEEFQKMKNAAMELGVPEFSYSQIALRAIGHLP